MRKETFGNAVVEYNEDPGYYCIPAFYVNGKKADIYDFGTMEHSRHDDNYGGVVCSAHFEPDEKMTDETRETYGINEEEFEEICDLLGEISGFSNCSYCF